MLIAKDRPIIFAGWEVWAALAGVKTQFRRSCEPSRAIDYEAAAMGADALWACPHGQVGGGLWVKETWALLMDPGSSATWNLAIPDERPTPDRTQLGHVPTPIYRAGADRNPHWRPSIHMPRWASRLTLEITSIRVERLQAISEADAKAEGVDPDVRADPDNGHLTHPYRRGFHREWDRSHGKRAPWSSNPWVWVVGFKVIK